LTVPDQREDPLGLLERATDQLCSRVAEVRPEQASLPTPCSEFNVRQLLNHTLFDVALFTGMLSGSPPGSPDEDRLGDDWSSTCRARLDDLLTAWRQRGLEGTLKTRLGEFPMSWAAGQHMTDLLVHTWDLARATGQSMNLDPELAEHALRWGRQNLKPEYRGTGFSPEVPVPDTAPIYTRLVAFFGRDPS
jgi:uncharacterized protein (TIGR03086 family)